MAAALTFVIPTLKARDLKATIEFYTHILAFTVQRQGLDWVELNGGGAVLSFYQHNSLEAEPGMTGMLYFYPRDIRALWAYLKHHAKVERELHAQDSGLLEFRVRDCNNYVLAFGQKAPDA